MQIMITFIINFPLFLLNLSCIDCRQSFLRANAGKFSAPSVAILKFYICQKILKKDWPGYSSEKTIIGWDYALVMIVFVLSCKTNPLSVFGNIKVFGLKGKEFLRF